MDIIGSSKFYESGVKFTVVSMYFKGTLVQDFLDMIIHCPRHFYQTSRKFRQAKTRHAVPYFL